METLTSEVTFSFGRKALNVFTHGDCWVLAQAIEKITGYPLITVTYETDYWVHVGNLLPSGMVIDITGIHGKQSWIDKWHKLLEGEFDSMAYALLWENHVFAQTLLDEEIKPAYPTYHARIPRLIDVMLESVPA